MGLPGFSLIIKIFSFVFSSWALVHLLAIFGVFLAIAYPLWWFLAPGSISCFFCRVVKPGGRCPFCRTMKEDGETQPKNFLSAFLNGGLILVFSFICFGLVFLEGQVLFKLGFPPTAKTVSFVIPPRGQYRLGEIFPLKIEIAGIERPINAVQTDLGFPPEKLEVVVISTQDSFANIFVQKEINNEAGWARLTGGLPNPGFFADKGLFGTVFLRGKSSGTAKVEFLPSSMVLANDGRGTNVIKQLASISYLILPERLSAKEEKEQEKIIQPLVLGEKASETQLKFYEEGGVLGSKVEKMEEKKFSLFQTAWEFWEKIDRFILSFWERVFHPLFSGL